MFHKIAWDKKWDTDVPDYPNLPANLSFLEDQDWQGGGFRSACDIGYSGILHVPVMFITALQLCF